MKKETRYTKPHKLILEALSIPRESISRQVRKMKDRDLYLLMNELNQACNLIVNAVNNTTKFEVKPSPEEFEDAEKLRPVIEEMQQELERRLEQSKSESC
jgi:hypothetical protein